MARRLVRHALTWSSLRRDKPRQTRDTMLFIADGALHTCWMRSKRWLVCGALALGGAAPFASACGDSSFESANDASISEAASDSSSSSSSDGSEAGFCSTQPDAVLCADFDESDPRIAFLNGSQVTFFSSIASTGGGVIGVTDSGLSAPNALEVALPVDAGPVTDASVETAQATGVFSKFGGATHFRLEADIRFNEIGDLSGGAGMGLGGISLVGTTEYTVVVIELVSGHVYADAFSNFSGGASLDLGLVPSQGPNWVHLRIDIMLAKTGGTLSGSLDGRPTTSVPSLANTINVLPTLSIGPSTMGGTGTIDLSFDNVLFFADGVPDAGAEAGLSAMDAAGD